MSRRIFLEAAALGATALHGEADRIERFWT
jgi:hypothetical protein